MENVAILIACIILAFTAVFLLVMVFAGIGVIINYATNKKDIEKKYIQKPAIKPLTINKEHKVTTVDVRKRKNATTKIDVMVLNPVIID